MQQVVTQLQALQQPTTAANLWDATNILTARGLVQSATWAREMYAHVVAASSPNASPPSLRPQHPDEAHPLYVHALGHFHTHQYRRCADVLKPVSNPLARFLRFYATYLAGERQKEEERQELADWTEPVNPHLDHLRAQLVALRNAGDMDAHLWYLLGVVFKRLHLNDDAIVALRNSLNQFPYNWGAWLELAPLCPTQQDLANLALNDHWVKALFTAYFLNETDESEQARQIYDTALAVIPHSVFLKGQLALCLYNLRMFDEAQHLYEDIFKNDAYCLDGADTYSNILYVKADKVQLSRLAHRCKGIDKFRLETCCVSGNYYALRGQHDQAVSYFQRALRLNRNYLSAWTLMGHEFLEMKNTAAAVEAYRRAVDINPKDFRAWYGLGQTYELLNMPLYTLYYYNKAATLRPRDSRMWCAVGQTYQELRRWDDAISCYERAIRSEDSEGLAMSKLAFLYERMARDSERDGRQHERMALYLDKAAEYYEANLKRRDNEKLGGRETADSLRFLTEYWSEKNDMVKAKKYCVRLLDHPGHHKDFVKTRLRQIHSREGRES